MSEDKTPYRIYAEPILPPEIGKTYYYSEYAEGTADNNFECGHVVKEILWTQEADQTELKYMKILFLTKAEAQILADQRNDEILRYIAERSSELKRKWKARRSLIEGYWVDDKGNKLK